MRKDLEEFEERQFAAVYPPGIEANYWTLARNWIIAEAIGWSETTGLFPKGGRMLEVGCGPGIVLHHLRSCGFDAWGVERGNPPLNYALGERLCSGIEAQDLPSKFRQSIHCLLVLDVLEHLNDPGGFLERLRIAFPSTSAILVTVPARQEVWSEWDQTYGHLRRYDPITLSNDLTRGGWNPRRTRYFFQSLYVAALVIRLLKMKRGVDRSAPNLRTAHRLVASYMWMESKVMGAMQFMPGLSLLSIASR
jgi:hypothetical protein